MQIHVRNMPIVCGIILLCDRIGGRVKNTHFFLNIFLNYVFWYYTYVIDHWLVVYFVIIRESYMLTYARTKKLTETKVEDNEDKINNLLDAIASIACSRTFISSNKLKTAVRTAILSTRWKSVWASAPNLVLNTPDFFLLYQDSFSERSSQL